MILMVCGVMCRNVLIGLFLVSFSLACWFVLSVVDLQLVCGVWSQLVILLCLDCFMCGL